MHWATEKSIGDGNEAVRHLMEQHFVAHAWRSMELCERYLTGMPPFDNPAAAKDELKEAMSEWMECGAEPSKNKRAKHEKQKEMAAWLNIMADAARKNKESDL